MKDYSEKCTLGDFVGIHSAKGVLRTVVSTGYPKKTLGEMRQYTIDTYELCTSHGKGHNDDRKLIMSTKTKYVYR